MLTGSGATEHDELMRYDMIGRPLMRSVSMFLCWRKVWAVNESAMKTWTGPLEVPLCTRLGFYLSAPSHMTFGLGTCGVSRQVMGGGSSMDATFPGLLVTVSVVSQHAVCCWGTPRGHGEYAWSSRVFGAVILNSRMKSFTAVLCTVAKWSALLTSAVGDGKVTADGWL